MRISETLLPEFDLEMANTRKTLARVPDDKLDWKPHEKSMTMRSLASHLSNLAGWPVYVIDRDSLDVSPVGEEPLRVPPVNSTEEALETFDKNVAAARAAIAGASDEELLKPWSLLAGGKNIFTSATSAFAARVRSNTCDRSASLRTITSPIRTCR